MSLRQASHFKLCMDGGLKKGGLRKNEMERAWKEQGNKHQNTASSVLTSCVILRYTLNLSEPKYPHLSCFYFFLMSIMSAVLIPHMHSKAQLNIFLSTFKV